MWYKATVLKGEKFGRTLGFPTVNLDSNVLPKNQKEGVYASLVKYNNTIYRGALFFGPRVILGEKTNVLEIYILDFDQEIYGKTIFFQIHIYIREVKNFHSFTKFKDQLKKDVKKVSANL